MSTLRTLHQQRTSNGISRNGKALTWKDANLDHDERAMAQAHEEYREKTGDDRPLSALETSTFHAITARAQAIKKEMLCTS